MKRDRRQVLTELLVLSAQGGSEDAFRQLHELWCQDLKRLAMLRIQQANEVDVVTQEVWLAIAKGLKAIDDPACFPRWAFRILERRAADWIRKRQAERRRDESWQRDRESRAEEEGQGQASETSAILAVREIIETLAPEMKQLVFLFYQAGRSVAEISVILGIPAGTVKSRLFKARELIKQRIERNTDERH